MRPFRSFNIYLYNQALQIVKWYASRDVYQHTSKGLKQTSKTAKTYKNTRQESIDNYGKDEQGFSFEYRSFCLRIHQCQRSVSPQGRSCQNQRSLINQKTLKQHSIYQRIDFNKQITYGVNGPKKKGVRNHNRKRTRSDNPRSPMLSNVATTNKSDTV